MKRDHSLGSLGVFSPFFAPKKMDLKGIVLVHWKRTGWCKYDEWLVVKKYATSCALFGYLLAILGQFSGDFESSLDNYFDSLLISIDALLAKFETFKEIFHICNTILDQLCNIFKRNWSFLGSLKNNRMVQAWRMINNCKKSTSHVL